MKNKSAVEEKLVQQILNRVRFHAPIVHDASFNRDALLKAGIDPCKPLFKFEKNMTKQLFHAFETASKIADFSLVVPYSSVEKIPHKMLKRLKNLTLFSPENCSLDFFEMVNKLNINYSASTNYDRKFSEKFFKINGEILNPKFEDFSLKKSLTIGEIAVEFREFVLNGSNFMIKLENFGQKVSNVEIELNIPLERGYFLFKRNQKSVKIENLGTGEVFFLNFNVRLPKFCFSEIEGLENSTFSCINVRAKVGVKRRETIFFNFGKDEFSLKDARCVKAFYEISKKKCYEIFDVKVISKNPKFDQFFNETLPQKIWLGWLQGKDNLLLEEKYLALKKLFVRDGEKIDFKRFEALGVKEIGIFNGEYYKKILVVQGAEKFFKVGRTYFYNLNSISKKSLKTREPVSICYGKK